MGAVLRIVKWLMRFVSDYDYAKEREPRVVEGKALSLSGGLKGLSEILSFFHPGLMAFTDFDFCLPGQSAWKPCME